MPKGKAQPKGTETRFEVIVRVANYLATLHLPYTNARPPSPKIGYDCSSSCAQLMMAAGYQVPFFNTATAPQYMLKGSDPSGRLTFWNDDVNGTAGDSVHMFATINGRDWGTGENGNPGWNDHTKEGFSPYHINQLDDPAQVPADMNELLQGSPNTEGSTGVTGSVDLQTIEAAAKAASFSTYLELPGILDSAESQALKGERSLMNDEPLMTLIEQLCQASLRRFQSMPNGNFYAFYPDYFGGMNHRTPYWEIRDIEILDGELELSDNALATHVYTVGDNTGLYDGVTEFDKAASAGVVTLFQAMSCNFITGLGKDPKPDPSKDEALANKERVIAFLKKYGARPYYEEAPMVRSGFYEMFLAFQRFCFLWSEQFLTKFEFTYMPELFPGGLISLPDHGLQLFVEEVTHDCDYESGFTTVAMLSSPVALEGGPKGIHEGMIRANVLEPPNG